MFEPSKLTNRHEQVLSATVRRYVATAEPVSSKGLLQGYEFAVSSATIRNAMGWLEKAGLLVQPHTSAGRVPSDLGYRFYVDRLMVPDGRLGRQAERRLVRELEPRSSSLEARLQSAARILAAVSGYIALVTPPQGSSMRLRHLQLVPVDGERVMLAIVTDKYETQSVLMSLPPTIAQVSPLTARELQLLSNFLSDRLQGLSLGELSTLDWGDLDREFQQYADFLQAVAGEVASRLQAPIASQTIVRGLADVLNQPEFTEMERVQALFQVLEAEQLQLAELTIAGDGITVRIGAENPLEPMQACTLVAANYQAGDTAMGSIGVIGPTRMLYEGAIAAVEATAGYLSSTLSEAN